MTAANNELCGLEEQHRRRVVQLILIVYYLMIFEGVLRKWVLPHWGRELFFIRDPFVLSIYALVLSRRTRVRTTMLEVGCVFAIVGLLLTAVQRSLADDAALPITLQVYGWRNYFLYLPLPFVMGRYLRMSDLERISSVTVKLSVAMAFLALLQFASPPRAAINGGFGDTADEFYGNQGLPGGFVRPFGTFTSNVGMGSFTVSALAMAIPLWLVPSRSRSSKRYIELACASVGPFACLALCGSRGAVVAGALVLLLAMGGLLLTPTEIGLKAVSVICILVLAGGLSAPILFPASIHAFATRWSDAGENEQQEYGSGGIFGRAIYEFFNFRLLFGVTPPQGHGLGSAGNAAWKLGTRNEVITFTSSEQIGAAESDWGRNILELGPLFGCLFILYRTVFTLWLAKETLFATIRSSHPLPWLLFTFVGIILFNGQITANGTTNAYGWLFVGFAIAAANCTKQPRRVERPVQRITVPHTFGRRRLRAATAAPYVSVLPAPLDGPVKAV